MKSKTDWFTILSAFQFGFCGNATLWRVTQGMTDDVVYPAMCAALALAALILHSAMKSRQNAPADLPPPFRLDPKSDFPGG
jgi:hypothetical protein